MRDLIRKYYGIDDAGGGGDSSAGDGDQQQQEQQQQKQEPDYWAEGDKQQPQYVTKDDLRAVLEELKGSRQQERQDPEEWEAQMGAMVKRAVGEAFQPLTERMEAQQAISTLEGRLSSGLNDAGKSFVSETLSKFNPQAIRGIAADKGQQDILRLAAEGAAARGKGKTVARSEPAYEADDDDGGFDAQEFERSWKQLSRADAIPPGVTKEEYRKEFARAYGRAR